MDRRAATEDGRADAHQRRAFQDRRFEVGAHAHRERVEIESIAPQLVEKLAQGAVGLALRYVVPRFLRRL